VEPPDRGRPRSIDGNSQHLVSRLQERYGYPRDRAEREAQEFIDDLDAVLAPRHRVRARALDASGNARAPGSPAPQSRTARSSSVRRPTTRARPASGSG
jgi:hypothetical protein